MATIEELKKAKKEQDSKPDFLGLSELAKSVSAEHIPQDRSVYEQYKELSQTKATKMAMLIGCELVENFYLSAQEAKSYSKAICWLLGFHHPEIDDPMKGLIVTGGTGTGKTLLVSVLRSLSERVGAHRMFLDRDSGKRKLKPFLWNCEMHALDHVEDYEKSGEYHSIGHNVLHIGDLGTEPANISRYGTKSSLSDLICKRSDMGYKDYPIIITTNLTWEGIKERYGDRVHSRLRGELIEVSLLGKDHRIK